MLFGPSEIPDVWLIDAEPSIDSRGSFYRAWCAEEFAARGLPNRFVQSNVSVNPARGTLRGLHWQEAPHAEAKLVRCARGAIFDVVVDLRVDSPTARRWIGVELSAGSMRSILIPTGCAHGFQTLTDDVEVVYQTTQPYVPPAARGLRFDDPALAIAWPLRVTRISEQDRSWPALSAL